MRREVVAYDADNCSCAICRESRELQLVMTSFEVLGKARNLRLGRVLVSVQLRLPVKSVRGLVSASVSASNR